MIGIDTPADGKPLVATGPDTTRELRVLVTVPAEAAAAIARSTGVTFRITDVGGGGEASVADHFIAR